MIGIATPSAQGLASATETNQLSWEPSPIQSVQPSQRFEKPGGNITGVSDHNPTDNS
ncbi:MAG: ABC transporter substrate binding protein [Streptococcus sp.]